MQYWYTQMTELVQILYNNRTLQWWFNKKLSYLQEWI